MQDFLDKTFIFLAFYYWHYCVIHSLLRVWEFFSRPYLYRPDKYTEFFSDGKFPLVWFVENLYGVLCLPNYQLITQNYQLKTKIGSAKKLSNT